MLRSIAGRNIFTKSDQRGLQEPNPPLVTVACPSADAMSPDSAYHVPISPVAVADDSLSDVEPDSPVGLINDSIPSTSKSQTETDLVDMAGEIEGSVAQVSNQFEAILPIPVRKRPHGKRTRLKSPTLLLTSKEHSDFLEAKQSKKKAAVPHIGKTTKPKVKHAEEKKRSKGNAKSKTKKIVSC